MDVLAFPSNVCRSRAELLRVAEGLRVPLRPARLAYRFVERKGIYLQVCVEWGMGRGEVALLECATCIAHRLVERRGICQQVWAGGGVG